MNWEIYTLYEGITYYVSNTTDAVVIHSLCLGNETWTWQARFTKKSKSLNMNKKYVVLLTRDSANHQVITISIGVTVGALFVKIEEEIGWSK